MFASECSFHVKGFKDLQKQTKSTEQVLAGLGKKLAGFFSVAALAKFSKDSVQAFLQDEKAAKSLTRTLGNLGLAFEDARVIKFLADLEKTSGVVDGPGSEAMDYGAQEP